MPRTTQIRPENILGPVLVFIIMFVVFSIYAPGRFGGFLLDDYVNIGPMAQAEQGFIGVVRYVFSGDYGAPGRWISKLSFLMDSPGWPSDAFRFKQNNILFHILNGLLVIWVFLSLMRLMGHSERMSQAVALILGTLWLLHPLNVSTTLYVVQRMTELSALFVLAGMLCYLKGRRVVADSPVRGYAWMSSGLIGGTVLGFLSKENAALLPLLVLTTESILLKELKYPRSFKYWKAVFLYFPSAALLLWLAYKFPGYLHMDRFRPFDLWERLMSESRALIDYLRLILIPTRVGTGVYHDDFQISRGLLDPPTTLASIVALAGIFGVAFKYRKRFPVAWFGVAWFFVGHILESTIVPLELYFEHRNYVPMLGPLFALCYYLLTCQSRISMILRVSLIVFTGLAAVSTWQNVYVWTDVNANLETWEKEHPNSPRLLQYASNLYATMEKYDEAQKKLHRIIELKPEWAGPKLDLIVLSCQSGSNRRDYTMDTLISDLAHAKHDQVSIKIIKNLLEGMQKKPCDMLTMEHIGRMIDHLMENPNYQRKTKEMANLYSLRARYHGYLGNYRQQALDFGESYRLKPNYYIAKAESEIWIALGEREKAQEAVSKLRQSNYIQLRGYRYHINSEEIEHSERIIKSLKSGG